jgi:hypothetical protein
VGWYSRFERKSWTLSLCNFYANMVTNNGWKSVQTSETKVFGETFINISWHCNLIWRSWAHLNEIWWIRICAIIFFSKFTRWKIASLWIFIKKVPYSWAHGSWCYSSWKSLVKNCLTVQRKWNALSLLKGSAWQICYRDSIIKSAPYTKIFNVSCLNIYWSLHIIRKNCSNINILSSIWISAIVCFS